MTRAARAAIAARAAASVAAAAALAALAGCPAGDTGTIALALATAPGSTVMDGVTRLRLTFTNPRQEYLVDRTERGFDLVLDLAPSEVLGTLVIEGLDAGGGLVATGTSPPFPLSAISARIVIYMAPPMSVAAAPVALSPPRTGTSAASLTYGVILAGGVESNGALSAAIQIYNAYDHSLADGLAMPAPRTGVTAAVATGNNVYLFGGTAPGGAPTGTLWSFDTTVQPKGRYIILSDSPPSARTGAAAVTIAIDRYLITGAPVRELSAGKLSEPTGFPAISSGAAVTGTDRAVTAVVVDDATGDLLRIRAGGTPEPIAAARRHGTAAALPGARIAVLAGDTTPRDALIVDAASGAVTTIPNALADAYTSLAAAATPRFLVAAGTRPGLAGTAVEILDATTLAPRHALTVADTITAAIALPNEQVLLVGAGLHLFTPPPPPLPLP